MYSQLNDKGQAAIVCSQGVLFRGSAEQKIREGLIGEDAIKAIIALPEKLFFGMGIPACVLVLNKSKPKERKDKIIFIYGAKDYKEGKNRNTLRGQDISRIVQTFKKFKDEDRYCHVADSDELKENEYNLNVPRYVDISKPEEEIDIQEAYDEVKESHAEQEKIRKKMEKDLDDLGIKV